MKNVRDFLERLGKITLPDETLRRAAAAAIKKHCGFSVPIENIKVRQNKVFINSPLVEKSEIYLKKEEILNELRRSLGNRAPTDIR